MTSLAPSPSIVALVAAADTLPVMLLALPAGAIADIVDRRRLLIVVQLYFIVVIGALAAITVLGLVTPLWLLGLTFAVGVGTALTMPTFSAVVPELVPPDELPSAVALNSIGVNLSRAVGPAIAGVLVAAVGPWLVFALDAVSSLGVLAVLLRWRREPRKSALPAERFLSALRVGLRSSPIRGRCKPCSSAEGRSSFSPAPPGRSFRSSCAANWAGVRRSTACC